MKIAKTFIYIILLLGCHSENEREISKVTLKFVDLNIITPIKIDCKNFEDAFADSIKTIVIEDLAQQKTLDQLVRELKLDNDGYYPDVRLKIEIVYCNGSTDIVCMSNLGVSFNDKPYKFSDNLYEFILQMLE